MAIPAGLEPATLCLEDSRQTLNYLSHRNNRRTAHLHIGAKERRIARGFVQQKRHYTLALNAVKQPPDCCRRPVNGCA
jgi:hypothetical protein